MLDKSIYSNNTPSLILSSFSVWICFEFPAEISQIWTRISPNSLVLLLFYEEKTKVVIPSNFVSDILQFSHFFFNFLLSNNFLQISLKHSTF